MTIKYFIKVMFTKTKSLEQKRLKSAFWYGFRHPFHKITDKELSNYLDAIK